MANCLSCLVTSKAKTDKWHINNSCIWHLTENMLDVSKMPMYRAYRQGWLSDTVAKQENSIFFSLLIIFSLYVFVLKTVLLLLTKTIKSILLIEFIDRIAPWDATSHFQGGPTIGNKMKSKCYLISN